MIDVADLSFTYPGAPAAAIRGLTFAVRPGEVFGFLGPSGAGKSTTQKVLIGLTRGYAGRAAVFGRDLAAWGPDYYERIGVAFEFPTHFLKLTAIENLTYFGRLYRGPVRPPSELLDLVGLGADGDMRVGQYSKGMKNRLSVARALVHSPELLFLDEPTAGLDPVNARRIKDLIRSEQAAGRTVFLTTHDMTVADELCDRVAFIVDGQIAVVDRPRDLKLRHGRATVRVEYADPGVGVESDHGAVGDSGALGGGHDVVDVADGRRGVREFPLDGLSANEAFLSVLRDHAVETIHTLEATLEDVFIQVTGRSLA